MNYPDPRQTAGVVLAAAARIDSRTPRPDPERLLGWAEVLAELPMTHAEAGEAVRRHYLRPDVKPVMPGDVVAAVRDMRAGDRYRTGAVAMIAALPRSEPNGEYRRVRDELAARRASRVPSIRTEGDTAS